MTDIFDIITGVLIAVLVIAAGGLLIYLMSTLGIPYSKPALFYDIKSISTMSCEELHKTYDDCIYRADQENGRDDFYFLAANHCDNLFLPPYYKNCLKGEDL